MRSQNQPSRTGNNQKLSGSWKNKTVAGADNIGNQSDIGRGQNTRRRKKAGAIREVGDDEERCHSAVLFFHININILQSVFLCDFQEFLVGIGIFLFRISQFSLVQAVIAPIAVHQ